MAILTPTQEREHISLVPLINFIRGLHGIIMYSYIQFFFLTCVGGEKNNFLKMCCCLLGPVGDRVMDISIWIPLTIEMLHTKKVTIGLIVFKKLRM